jgi:hypothetical protein
MNRVIDAKANEDFSLDLKFEDGSVKRFDVTPYLNLGVFRELKDADYFKQVTIAFGTVQWPNEQDISPDTLYIEGVDTTGSTFSKPSAPELAGQTR